MNKICWLNDSGTIAECLSEGELYIIDHDSVLEWRIAKSSPISKTCKIRIKNDSPILFVKTKENYYSCRKKVRNLGILEFCVEFIDPNTKILITTHSSKILVQPSLIINQKLVLHNFINLQTNLSRCLGPLSLWKTQFLSQIDLGYNLFHITSVNLLGKHNSLYSIGDYEKLNPIFFENPEMPEPEKYEILTSTVKEIENYEGGMIIDIVLNHCSSVNPLFSMNPNAAFTIKNTPHLMVAYVLDSAMLQLSEDIEKGVSKYKKTKIFNEEDLKILLKIVKIQLFALNLHEFFQMKTEQVLNGFVSSETSEWPESIHEQYLRAKDLLKFMKKYCLLGEGESRYGVTLNNQVIWKTCKSLGMSRETIIQEVTKETYQLNSWLLTRFNRHMQKILLNIESEIRYQKLEKREFKISAKKPLIKPYFTQLLTGDIALLNGFIANNKNISKDPTGKWAYFKRKLFVWRDCVKLNYGENKHKCPELWKTIKNYVKNMAKVFKGFRLDNCHGTPVHVSDYFMQKARKVNPGLLIFAEFYSSSLETDVKYMISIGINYYIRESLAYKSCSSEFLQLFDKNADKNALKRKIPIILYDFTHDNPTVPQCRTIEDVLPNLSLVTMIKGPIGSTRGYEEVIPYQLSVLKEKRLYPSYELSKNTQKTKLLDAENDVINVVLEYKGPADAVDIRGDWDGWKVPISLNKKNGIFSVSLEFPALLQGTEYGFKFILNKKDWVCDLTQPNYLTWDGFHNNFLKVEENLWTLPETMNDLRLFRKYFLCLRKILAREAYNKITIESYNDDIVTITRENPFNCHTYMLITRQGLNNNPNTSCSIPIPGYVEKINLITTLRPTGKYNENLTEINGIPIEVTTKKIEELGNFYKIKDKNFLFLEKAPIGLVLLLKTRPVNESSVIEINKKFLLLENEASNKYLVENLSLTEVAYIIFDTDENIKEKNNPNKYFFPDYKTLAFEGFGGLLPFFYSEKLEESHPVYKNLYEGNWYLDYQISRLQNKVSDVFYFFIQDSLDYVKQLQRKLVPGFAIQFFKLVYELLENHAKTLMKKEKILSEKSIFYYKMMETRLKS